MSPHVFAVDKASLFTLNVWALHLGAHTEAESGQSFARIYRGLSAWWEASWSLDFVTLQCQCPA